MVKIIPGSAPSMISSFALARLNIGIGGRTYTTHPDWLSSSFFARNGTHLACTFPCNNFYIVDTAFSHCT